MPPASLLKVPAAHIQAGEQVRQISQATGDYMAYTALIFESPVDLHEPRIQQHPSLPGEDGEDLGWVRWGRRKGEPGASPQDGWAKLETIERGGWQRYNPQRVLGLVQRYMEKDAERTSHWFDLEPGYALQCLLIGEGDHRHLYVVTTSPPPEYAWIHDRWPMVGQIS